MRAEIIAVVHNKGIMEIGTREDLLEGNGYFADMYRTWRNQQEAT